MKRSISFISSILVVITYLVFTVLSAMQFPTPFSPTRNWLSDFGSSTLNPGGAIYYNIGIVLSGVFVLVFFVGLSAWLMKGNKVQNFMLWLTQIFGSLGAISMVMSAIFPITKEGLHSFWSAALYILLGTGFGFSVAALRYYSRFPRGLLVLGVLVAAVDMVWGVVLNIYLVEWVTVGLLLVYILLLGIETNRRARYGVLDN